MLRLEWDNKTIDLQEDGSGLRTRFVEVKNESVAMSGQIETVRQHGKIEGECGFYIFGSSEYSKLVGWWSWARQGKAFSFANESTKTTNVTINGAYASSGTNLVPLSSRGTVLTGDRVFLKTVADDEFEMGIITAIATATGMKITLKHNLLYSYSSGDTLRHADYFPSVITMDKNFSPTPRAHRNMPTSEIYELKIKFRESS